MSSCVEMRRFCLPVSEGCGVCRVGRVVGEVKDVEFIYLIRVVEFV